MIKINRRKAVMFLLFAVVLMISASCTKAECKTGSDCAAKTCYLSSCESKKCTYTLQRNCCGNGLKDSIEDGKTGDQCTCPQDYGKCEGKSKIKIGSREEDSRYLSYHCNAYNKCILGVASNDITPQNFLDLIDPGFFKASSVIKYNKPFDASKNSFEIAITLDDTSKDLLLPIQLTKLKLLYSSDYGRAELLIAEKSLGNVLDAIGSTQRISTPLTLEYKPQEVEESGSLRYIIDYTYTKQVISGRSPTGANIYSSEIVRGSFNSPSKQIFFVRSG